MPVLNGQNDRLQLDYHFKQRNIPVGHVAPTMAKEAWESYDRNNCLTNS